MRTSTRPADGTRGAGLRGETYATRWGVGEVTLVGDLPLALELPDTGRQPAAEPGEWGELLQRYFAGERVAFPLDVEAHARAHACTEFEVRVLQALATVPYGRTASYQELAVAAGYPNAYRAVGSVMARNELPVILPCHRIIRSDGELGDYGDDPEWKVRLLTLEGYLPRTGRS